MTKILDTASLVATHDLAGFTATYDALAAVDLEKTNRKDLRALSAALVSDWYRAVNRNSASSLRNALSALRHELSTEIEGMTPKKRVGKWDRIISQIIADHDDAPMIRLTQSDMIEYGFSKSARNYRAYWSHNPAGRAAQNAGRTPKMMKCRGTGEMLLILFAAGAGNPEMRGGTLTIGQ